MDYTKFETISIRNHSQLNERWVQARIEEDTSILGLGDVVVKDRERIQPRAGRLDLLPQDTDSTRRYEVEIQLGATDESHIIRTIEYWDIERKRYPQYEHTAVIIAEDITSRFLNVINLFNGVIPLIAIQMKALSTQDRVGLVFTTVIDQMTLGFDDEEEQEPADRSYWEGRGSKKTVAIADQLLQFVKKHDPAFELKYNKFYIGLSKRGVPRNFVTFIPQKDSIRFEPRLKNSPDTQKRLETAGLDDVMYDNRWGRYRIRIKSGDVEKHHGILTQVIAEAYEASEKD